MFRSLILFTIASFILLTKPSLIQGYEAIEKVYYDLDLSQDIFKNFILEYNKKYTKEQFDYRFQVFQENLRRINKLNQEQNSALYGLTPFSDLTTEELMKSTSCMFNTTGIMQEEVPNIKVPEELDYRKQNLVTEVKNQQQCGSCYIFSAIGDIEGQHAKKHKELVSLSEQYVLDCDDASNCGGGVPSDVANWLSQVDGAVRTTDYPYTAVKESCKTHKKPAVKVKGGRITAVRTNEQLKIMLANHGPLSIGLNPPDGIFFYKKGIIRMKCLTPEAYHAVVLVGYGKENDWIIKNSWGRDWGEDGYVRIDMDSHCGIGLYICPSEVY